MTASAAACMCGLGRDPPEKPSIEDIEMLITKPVTQIRDSYKKEDKITN